MTTSYLEPIDYQESFYFTGERETEVLPDPEFHIEKDGGTWKIVIEISKD